MLLTGAMRARIPTSKFALPGERKYPVEDPAHAANAKARATQQLNAGNITPAQHAEIFAKANRVLVGHALASRKGL